VVALQRETWSATALEGEWAVVSVDKEVDSAGVGVAVYNGGETGADVGGSVGPFFLLLAPVCICLYLSVSSLSVCMSEVVCLCVWDLVWWILVGRYLGERRTEDKVEMVIRMERDGNIPGYLRESTSLAPAETEEHSGVDEGGGNEGRNDSGGNGESLHCGGGGGGG